jgi:subtilase family serine protease
MKRIIVMFTLLSTITISSYSEEKPKADTLLTLSIPAVDKRINEYKSAINYAIQIRGEAQKTVEQTNENIKTLQTAITVLEALKVDSVMKVQKKK